MYYKPKNVDDYINHQVAFQDVLSALRALTFATELEEKIKWSMPVYTSKTKM